MFELFYEAYSLSIKGRIAIKKYCEETPKSKRSWDDFNKSYNTADIQKEEYDEGIKLFGGLSGNSVAKPVEAKPVPKVEPKKPEPKKEPKIEPKVEPKPEVKPKPKEELKDTPNTTKDVDGFMISTAPTFRITEAYVRKRYIEFNKKYFEGKLPLLPIVFRKTKNTLGSYSYRYRPNGEVYNEKLNISIFYLRDEFYICSTILHEMIHIYQHHVLNLSPSQMRGWRAAHGRSFQIKMNEINKFGWKINLKADKEEQDALVASPEQVDRLKRKGLVICSYNDTFLALVKKENMNYIRLCFSTAKLKFFNILDYTPFVDYPIGTKRLRGRGTTPQKLQALVDKKILSPIETKSIYEGTLHNDDKYDIPDCGMVMIDSNGEDEEWAVV